MIFEVELNASFCIIKGYKTLSAREWNVMVLNKTAPKGVAQLRGVALLEEVCHYWDKS